VVRFLARHFPVHVCVLVWLDYRACGALVLPTSPIAYTGVDTLFPLCIEMRLHLGTEGSILHPDNRRVSEITSGSIASIKAITASTQILDQQFIRRHRRGGVVVVHARQSAS
jgi:hypothetical protein